MTIRREPLTVQRSEASVQSETFDCEQGSARKLIVHPPIGIALAELITPQVFDPIAWGQRSATPGIGKNLNPVR
jgi:hypothetical protein